MNTIAEHTPVQIFVRHSAGCKYEGDESAKRCQCRKWLRWRAEGKQHRRKANTRSWAQAEIAKRDLEDQLGGKTDSGPTAQQTGKTISAAIDAFIAEKTVENISDGVLKAYQRLLRQLNTFCEGRSVYTIPGITRELLTEFVGTWIALYPSSVTRANRRQRLRAFLNFCFQSEWLVRVPPIVKITPDPSPTLPLDDAEYKRLLDAVFITVGCGDLKRQTTENGGGRWQYQDASKWQHAVYAYIQLMRWTGLAPIDAMTLRRDALTFDAEKNLYHVSTNRNKTGVPVKIPVSKQVGDDLLKVEVGSKDYFFWSGNGKAQSAVSNWGTRYVAPCFKAAGIPNTGNMLSYRLRDTFAVHLLEEGASMEDVARLLGNSIRVCERHYGKWSKRRQDKVDAFVSTTFEQAPIKRNRPGRKPKQR